MWSVILKRKPFGNGLYSGGLQMDIKRVIPLPIHSGQPQKTPLTTPSRFWGQSVVEFQIKSPLKMYKLTIYQHICDSC